MGLGQNPYRAILEAALLKFRPVNLDVLPLYIVLLAAFPFVLPVLVRWPWAVLLASFGLYVATLHFDWNLPGYPDDKVWFFNPMAWQVVFYLRRGAGGGGPPPRGARPLTTDHDGGWPSPISFSPPSLPCRGTIMPWSASFPTGSAAADLSDRQDQPRYPAVRCISWPLAWLVRLAVPARCRFPASGAFCEPIRRCGEHSLQIFCLGTFLAVTAQIIVAHYEDSIVSQLFVSLAGIAIMSLAAYARALVSRSARAAPRCGHDALGLRGGPWQWRSYGRQAAAAE